MNLEAPLTDKSNALECLAACAAVYDTCNLETVDAHIEITVFDTYILIAVRGSKSPEDWLNDLAFPKIITIYGQIHTGFWRSYLSIQYRVRMKLKELPNLPIIVVGHSLGGAQAVLCANDLSYSNLPVAYVITFGGPRVADAEFASHYNPRLGNRTLRYVNARDIVPRVPFSDMGYVHVGQEGFLPSTGGLEVNPSVWEMLHDDVVGAVTDIRAGNLELLNDHHLPRYAERLQAA